MIPTHITALPLWWTKHPWIMFWGLTLLGGPLAFIHSFRKIAYIIDHIDRLPEILVGTLFISFLSLGTVWFGSFICALRVTWKLSKIRAVAVVVVPLVIAVGLWAMPPMSPFRRRGPDSEVWSNLRNLHTGCLAYWIDTDPQNDCTVEIASRYGTVISPKVFILASGNKETFTATGFHEDSPRTHTIDAHGDLGNLWN